ncbi:unnamed protein product [Ectocarpus sp. 12 AP-2014]
MCIEKFLLRSNKEINIVCTTLHHTTLAPDGKMNESVANNAPLIPMSEMFLSSTKEGSEPRQPADHQHVSKKASLSYVLQMIESELDNLAKLQTKNNEEIKKRMTGIHGFRENNLVVVGAMGGLKKIRDKL